tara:strand:+ start:98 stop:463 length:366 start_codon:yes stop_codon:yes gene_type:complete
MAASLLVLGQAELGTGAFGTVLYTVPTTTDSALGSGTRFQTVVTSIVLCNRHSSANLYSIRVVPNEETAAVKHIIFNSVSLATNATDIISLGLTVESGDKIEASASVASTLSVSVFGVETS